MNISIDDIKYLERFANEEPCGGKVWKMANEGKTYYEIAVEVGEIAVEVGESSMGKKWPEFVRSSARRGAK